MLRAHQMKQAFFKKLRRRIKRKSGQALVETLVAVSIMAIGITGISRIIVLTMQMTDIAREENVSIQLAKNRLERIYLADFGDLMMWAESNQVVNCQGQPDPSGHYMISSIVTYPDSPATNYAKVTIRVSMRNRETLKFDRRPKEFAIFTAELK